MSERTEREATVTPASGPALTITEKARTATWAEVHTHTHTHTTPDAYRSGNQRNASIRAVSEPAPTVHFGHDFNEVTWLYDRRQTGGDGTPVRLVPTSEPAPTMTASGLATATTVNADARISEPGHHDSEESGSQQKNAVRVTIQEVAILQGFPRDFPWQGSRTARFRQIGNAPAAAGKDNPQRAPAEQTATTLAPTNGS